MVKRLGVLSVVNSSNPLSIAIPNTQNTSALGDANPLFTAKVGPSGALLYSAAILASNIYTQSNYSFKLEIDGVTFGVGGPNDQSAVYQAFGVAGFNPIAEGTAWSLPPNARIRIFAYNSNSAVNDGEMSVSVTFDNFNNAQERDQLVGA